MGRNVYKVKVEGGLVSVVAQPEVSIYSMHIIKFIFPLSPFISQNINET